MQASAEVGVARRERRTLVAVVVPFSIVYALIGLLRHWRFESNYDLGIFDQAVWHMSRFQAPASTISGFSNILGDHFYPILVVLTPLYWIAPAPETLLIAQAALLAASAVPVFLFLRTRLAFGPTVMLTVAHGLFWGVQRTAEFDFHALAFAPLLVATAIVAIDRRRWGPFWITATALALVKEDQLPLLAGMGVWLLLLGERRRGALVVGGSLVAFLLVIGVVVPAFNDGGGYAYAAGLGDLLRRPWMVPVTLVTPPVKLQTALNWVAPFVLMPLASPLALLATPLALARFLSPAPEHWDVVFHYTAPLAPILAMSAGDGLARLSQRMRHEWSRRRLLTIVPTLSVVLCATLPGSLPLWDALNPARYRMPLATVTGAAALALVPDGASVTAQTAIVPHLSRRAEIHVLDADAPDTEYVLASDLLDPWPATSFSELQVLLDERRARGYEALFEQDGWVVLRRAE